MPYVAPFGITGSALALFFAVLIGIFKNFTAFIGGFSASNFVTGYLGIPLYLILLVGWKVMKRTKPVNPEEADFFTGKESIDEEEKEFLAVRDAQLRVKKEKGGWGWWYERVVGLVF